VLSREALVSFGPKFEVAVGGVRPEGLGLLGKLGPDGRHIIVGAADWY
jgi:hypothetical protein